MKGLAGGIASLGGGILVLACACYVFMFAVGGCANFHRTQQLKNTKNNVVRARLRANNSIQLTEIELRRYNQQKKIEKAKADVRYIHSVGIRRAQDEVAKTLTPLYVSFEMTQALQAIATSGKNNSIIYVPTNPSTGLPIIPGLQPAR